MYSRYLGKIIAIVSSMSASMDEILPPVQPSTSMLVANGGNGADFVSLYIQRRVLSPFQ